MEKPHPLSVATLLVALIALLISVGGVADAAKHKIGKNLVVTKSIKNSAVTGDKVRDGTLTTADLVPGTIPAAGSGKSIVLASTSSTPTAGNGSTVIAPSGAYSSGGESFVGIAPVTIKVGDLHAVGVQQGIGQAVQVALESAPDLGGGAAVLSCTIVASTSTCASAQEATIPAGNLIYFRVTNGPGGSIGGFIAVSYTVRVP